MTRRSLLHRQRLKDPLAEHLTGPVVAQTHQAEILRCVTIANNFP